MLLLNFREELAIAARQAGAMNLGEHCTDSMLRRPAVGQALVGHNEDGTMDSVNNTYFVQASLVGLVL